MQKTLGILLMTAITALLVFGLVMATFALDYAGGSRSAAIYLAREAKGPTNLALSAAIPVFLAGALAAWALRR